MVFIRMRRGLGDGAPGMGAAIGALDAVFNPAAARAREDLDARHERVVPVPSPGDRLLSDGVVAVEVASGRRPGTGVPAADPVSGVRQSPAPSVASRRRPAPGSAAR